MAKLSTTAWVIHDLGLAASIGGTLFGRMALQPALSKVALPEERDLVSADAWRRFSWINLISHGAFAASWAVGRAMLGGEEVSMKARSLTRTKDYLVGASLITGVASIVLGGLLGKRGREGRGPSAVRESERFGHSEQVVSRTRGIQRGVGALGVLNLLATAGVLAITTMLAMEGNESLRFSETSRRLP